MVNTLLGAHVTDAYQLLGERTDDDQFYPRLGAVPAEHSATRPAVMLYMTRHNTHDTHRTARTHTSHGEKTGW